MAIFARNLFECIDVWNRVLAANSFKQLKRNITNVSLFAAADKRILESEVL